MIIQNKLDYAVKKWNLTDITSIYEQSVRAVYRANAEAWGSVIVKINTNTKELCYEAAMLKVLQGNGCCRLYVYEEEQGILVEEQLCPGTVLREESDARKRVESFASVFEKLHECAEENILKSSMPESDMQEAESYLEWLASAKQFCEESAMNGSLEMQIILKESRLLEKMQRAYEIGVEQFEKYPERVLLHGDLHHDNILKNKAGGYSVIDPKGVMGPEIFDVPRFVLNEFGYVKGKCAEEIKGHLEHVMQLITKRLSYPLEDIRKLLYMEMMLACAWSVEDGEEIDEMQMQVVEDLWR